MLETPYNFGLLFFRISLTTTRYFNFPEPAWEATPMLRILHTPMI